MPEVTKGPPGATVIPCPLAACDWAHIARQPGPEEHPGALADVFGLGVFAATATAQRLRDTEEALRAHLSSHDLAEWVAEVTRLRDENTRLRTELEEARA